MTKVYLPLLQQDLPFYQDPSMQLIAVVDSRQEEANRMLIYTPHAPQVMILIPPLNCMVMN